MSNFRKKSPWTLILLTCAGASLAAGIFWRVGSAAWSPDLQPPSTRKFSSDLQATQGPDEDCLMCHADPDFKGEFEDGELRSLFVDLGEYQRSVHGPAGLECVACHTAIRQYPHHQQEQVTCVTCHEQYGDQDAGDYATLRVKLPYLDRREMTLTINEACRSCHEREFEVAGDSAHVKAQLSGNREAPVCVDCHGTHDISQPDQPRTKISATCAICHRAVYSTYRSSVHGAALESEANFDVPTCVDCHGVHSVRGPRDSAFRNDSITVCGGCHSDQELMARYGISVEVFDTYLDDFHGRTVDLFRRQGSGMPSNKATCFDCHGIHNIRQPEDPLSTVYPDNLQHTCQQCHPDASLRFPSAWLSHYIPSWEKAPVLYAVNVAYQGLIPLTIGGFIVYIGLDARKRWLTRREIVRRALAEEDLDDDVFIG